MSPASAPLHPSRARRGVVDLLIERPLWSSERLDRTGGDPVSSDDLRVRFAEFDGASVAWSSIGSGPAVVVSGWWCSHLRLNWEDPRFRDYIGRLARHRTVIRYDRPGTGLSRGGGAAPQSLEDEYRVLAGLADALGLESFALLAGSAEGPPAAVYAARHPERVERLVLYGGYVRGADISPPAVRDALIAAVEAHWGLGSRMLADVFLPEATARERAEFVEFQRRAATPAEAAAALRALHGFDCSAELGSITAPTLVLHRRDDRAMRFELGRELADAIPGGRFVALEGADHFPWRGDRAGLAEQVAAFLEGRPAVPAATAEPVTTDLTPREREVLALVADGATDADIAAALFLSEHTVHRHVANIRTKLGVTSRAAAVAWATTHGIL